MTMSLRNFSSVLVLAAALCSTGALAQDASIDQVYQAANAGRFGDAQTMMDKVLRDHPNSAKAHYVEAELLAKQGKMPAAESELANAQRLDPSGNFAKPGALQELRNQLAASHNVVRPAQPAPQMNYTQPPVTSNVPVQRSSGGGSGMLMIIVIIAVIAFIVIVARAIGRRTGMVGGGYGPGVAPAAGYGGGYGPGGMPMGGGGMGSGIMGGLATGAAMGAGLVAGEELVHHFTDGDRGGNMIPNSGGGGGGWDNSPPPQNTDMGGNDFGVADSGSWDSGGGGGGGDMGGGGGDWN
jgi:uncharacterized protein